MDKLDIKFLNSHSQIRKYCKNSTNGIEDPIFTGFTMSIDKLHSPLFYTLCEEEFDDTLRSPGGIEDTTGGKISISQHIENKLKGVYNTMAGDVNTYGIYTVNAKDPFSTNNGRKPGYGLQEWHYLDEVLYGAADYIYMVDKIKVASGAFGPEGEGTNRLGGGTPDKVFVENNVEEETKSDINDISIYFECDEYDIPWQVINTEVLETLITSLTENENTTVTLVGYASVDGTEEHNKILSNNRVNAVKEYIISKGIDDKRINSATGQGETSQFDSDEPYPNRVVVCKFNTVKTQSDKLAVEEQTAELEAQSAEKAASDPVIENEHNRNLIELYGQDGEGNPLTKDNADKNSIYGKYKDACEDIEDRDKDVKELELKIEEQLNDLNKELKDYQSDMETYLGQLSTTDGDKSSIKSKINKTYEDFEEFINLFNKTTGICEGSSDYSDVCAKFKTFNLDDSFITTGIYKIEGLDFSTDMEYAAKSYAVLEAKVTEEQVNYKTNMMLISLKVAKSMAEKALYGGSKGSIYDEKGNEYNENNPAPDSLYQQYQDLLKKINTDEYSQKQEVQAEKEEKVETAKEKRQRERRERREARRARRNGGETGTDTPTVDNPVNENPTNENADSSQVYFEIPQTVYDMIGFRRDMLKIINDHPYVFQSITGLDEAYKKYFEVKDPHMGSGDDKISIECLEFLDMRVSAMFNKYFNAVYDRQYRRERVPINLRRFNCSIFIHDIRNFRNSIDNLNVEGHEDLNAITQFALNYMSAIEFKFFDCEIVPSETGSIFETVSNNSAGDMRRTKFTFTYGNCVINFLPFDDLRRYILKRNIEDIKPGEMDTSKSLADATKNDSWGTRQTPEIDDGNTRRWFDRSVLGNVNNNDYREYVRKDSSVAVDDYYKTSIVNNFAAGSVAQKNKELTAMDDALRRMVVGISASTGIPTKGVVDSLNIGFIDQILNETDKSAPVIKQIGNVNNSKVIDTKTTEYIGTVIEEKQTKPVRNVSSTTERTSTERTSSGKSAGSTSRVTSKSDVGDTNEEETQKDVTPIKDLGNVYED